MSRTNNPEAVVETVEGEEEAVVERQSNRLNSYSNSRLIHICHYHNSSGQYRLLSIGN
jgi:hypothetical protein